MDGAAPPAERSWPAEKSWPEGATAGLLLVAAGCLALGALLYRVAGPRDVVGEEAVIEVRAGRALTE